MARAPSWWWRAAVCYASRATLLTGQFNRRHGVDSFEEQLSPAAFAKTYPVLLRESGYYTGFIGKWGLGSELPVDAFDEWAGFAGPVYEQLFDLVSDPYEEREILHTPAVFEQNPSYYLQVLSDLRQRWLELRTALE